MARTIGEAVIVIKSDTAKFSGDMRRDVEGALKSTESSTSSYVNKINNQVGSIFSKLTRVAKIGAAVGATAILGMGASLTYVGASYNDLEQRARAAFTTILGTSGAAEEMMQKVAKFGKTSPFPRQAFIKGTQQLLGFGVAAENIIPTLNAVQNAVAATGGSAEDISAITSVFADIEGQGKLTGEALFQLGEYGIDAASLIGAQMGKTSDEIRTMASMPGGIPADQVFMPLVNGLEEKFAGAAANVKNTWSGTVDRIKGAWRDLSSDFMEPVISKSGGGMGVELANTFADSLRSMQSTVMPMISGTFASIVSEAMPFLNKMMMVLPGMLGQMISIIGPVIGEIVPLIGGALFDAFKAFLPVLPVIVDVVGRLAELFANNLADAISAVAPIIAQISAALATGLDAAFDALLPILDGLTSSKSGVLADVFDAIAVALPPIIQFIGQLAATFAGGLASAINAVAPVIGDIAQVLGDSLVTALQAVTPLLPTLGTLFSNIAGVVGGALASAFKAMAPVVPKLASAFMQIAGVVGGALLDTLDAIAPLLPKLSSAFVALAPVITKLATAFASVLVDALEALVPILPKLVEALGGAFLDVLNAIIPVLPQLVDAFTTLANTFVTALVPILPMLVDAFLALLPALLPIIPPLVSLVVHLTDLIAKVPPGVIQAIATAFLAFSAVKAATGPITMLSKGIGGVVSAGKGLASIPGVISSMAKTGGISSLSAAFKVLKSSILETKVGALGLKAVQLAQAAASKVAAAAQWVWNAAMSANPIMLVVAGIAALIAGLVLAYNKVGWFRDFVNAVFNGIKTVVMGVVNFITTNWSTISGILMAPFNAAKAIISPIFDGIKAIISGVINFITTNWSTVSGIITAPIRLAVAVVKAEINAISAVFGAVRDFVGGAVSAIAGFVTGIPGKIRGAIDSIFGIFQGPFNLAKGWITTAIDDIIGIVAGIPDKVKFVLSTVADVISAPFKAVSGVIKNLWNSTIGGFGVTIPDIPGLPGRGERFEIPEIHHTGGIAGGPVGADVLAILQGGERVFTTAQTDAISRALSGLAPDSVQTASSGASVVIEKGAIDARGLEDPWATAEAVGQVISFKLASAGGLR